MEDMLTFLTRHIRAAGMTVDEFTAKCGNTLTRQKFYRYAKEPVRLTDELIEEIAKALEFSEQQKKFLYTCRTGGANSGVSLDDAVHEALFSDLPVFAESQPFEFECRLPDSDGAFEWSAESLAKHILGIDGKESSQNFFHSFTVTIYNCLSIPMSSALAKLLHRIELDASMASGESCSIKISHYVGRNPASLEDKLDFFKCALPFLSLFNDYRCERKSLANQVWSKSNNLCAIKHVKKDKSTGKEAFRHHIINMSDAKAHVAEFKESCVLDYLTIDTKGMPVGRTDYTNALTISMLVYKLTSEHPRLMIHRDLCFDNIESRILLAALAQADESAKCALASILDAQSRSPSCPVEQQLAELFKYLQGRYDMNESTQAINLLYAAGLTAFAESRFLSELSIPVHDPGGGSRILGESLKFSPDLMIEILENIKSRLGDPPQDSSERHQRYHIIKPVFGKPKNTWVIYKGCAVLAYAPESLHKLDSETMHDDPDVADIFYDYARDKLLSSKGRLDSFVMTDGEAAEFIERLESQIKASA